MTSIATEWNTRGQSVAKQLIIPPCSLANPRSWVWEAGWRLGLPSTGVGVSELLEAKGANSAMARVEDQC
jgi:hypothetical protein